MDLVALTSMKLYNIQSVLQKHKSTDLLSGFLQEVGIPIDMVAGVSIGAFIGALYALEKDVTRVTQKAREWSMVSHCSKECIWFRG